MRSARTIAARVCDAVTLAGIAGLAFLVAVERLPALLEAVAAQVLPALPLEVGDARFDPPGRLELRRVRLRDPATGAAIVTARRVVLRFSPGALRAGHLDAVVVDGVRVTPPATIPDLGRGGGPGTAWSIGRTVVRHGRFHMPVRDGLPGASFRFAAELRDLGTAPGLAATGHRVAFKDGAITGPGGTRLATLRGARVRASLAGLLEDRRVDEVRLLSPAVTIAGALPALPARDGDAAEDGPAWTLARLIVQRGRVRVAPTADRPGVAFRVTTELRDLGGGDRAAALPRDVTLRHPAVVLPGGAPVLAADALRLRFTLAGLRARRLDEAWLAAPVVSVAETQTPAGGARGGTPEISWTVGRLVARDGALRLAPAGDLPGVQASFAFDLTELGTDPARAARVHHVGVRDLRVRWARQPTSAVIDQGGADFTLAGLLRDRRFERLTVARGLVVLDRVLRERLQGNGPGGAGAGPEWSVAVLELQQLGLRLGDLGPGIPDLTLMVRTRLTDLPLGAAGLARADATQQVELSNITLESPLDPFRPVVHVGSVFAQFSLAGLVRRQIAALAVVSPTIYLGEDLIWYMNATRGQAAAAPGDQPWTVRHLRTDLGRVVFTFKGVDRVGLPLRFRTDAHNVALGDLTALRVAAALEVPEQDYSFPGLDLHMTGVRGTLRFDYPPGEATENVVNTLQVAEIRWRDYRITGGWFTATFDEHGINGSLGGAAYDGYLNGGASVPFQPGPASGWASATDLDLAPIAATAAGSYLEMTGLIDLEGAVKVVQDRIDRADAKLDFKLPGHLRFPALDRLLANLPASLASWQRDLARIAIDTFRDYPYETGAGRLRFADARGELHLGLDGARGTRQFDVFYYQDQPQVVRAAPEDE